MFKETHTQSVCLSKGNIITYSGAEHSEPTSLPTPVPFVFVFVDLAASRNSPMLKSSFFVCMVSREDWGLSVSDEISCKYNGDLFLT